MKHSSSPDVDGGDASQCAVQTAVMIYGSNRTKTLHARQTAAGACHERELDLDNLGMV